MSSYRFLFRLPLSKWRKVGMTSSQHGPYVLGDTHATMAGDKELRTREGELISAKPVSVRIAG